MKFRTAVSLMTNTKHPKKPSKTASKGKQGKKYYFRDPPPVPANRRAFVYPKSKGA